MENEKKKEAKEFGESGDTISFEKALLELQEAVKKLESGDLPLDEALKTFENGVKLAGICQSQLKVAQLKVETLEKNNGELPSQAVQE